MVAGPQVKGLPRKGGGLGREWASLVNEVGVGAVNALGGTWAGREHRNILSSWQKRCFGHLSGTRCWPDSCFRLGLCRRKQLQSWGLGGSSWSS